jgi:adenosylcobinamide-phosphate synthase
VRAWPGWVSREVDHLSADEVRQSAIESLAENLNDSVVAPLFWFALAGLPGAALYRFANTADAMWGYPGMRGGRYWQWAGKWAARVTLLLLDHSRTLYRLLRFVLVYY